MARTYSKRLVIDATVAKASGGPSAFHPVSARCRDLLMAVLDVCHRIVMNKEIVREWDEHESGFAKRWRSWMARKDKVAHADARPDKELRSAVERSGHSDRAREVMLKDIHLIEAALTADLSVISLDEDARDCFGRLALAEATSPLGKVLWVNPSREEENVLAWLKQGARPEKHRRLRHA